MGKHDFVYEINDAFFDVFEHSLVKSGNLTVNLELDKQETMLILLFHIRGEIKLSCDVCLGDYPSAVEIQEREIVKFSDDENLADTTEEIIILNKNDFEIDISGLIYEYVNLAVPYFTRCQDEGNTPWCDKEMLAKLRQLSAGEQHEETDNADPRWEALKNIKTNN